RKRLVKRYLRDDWCTRVSVCHPSWIGVSLAGALLSTTAARRSSHDPYLPVRFGDTPKYVPPEEVAEQYYNHVRQSNKALIMRSWPSSASSFCGGISRN